MIGPLPMRRRTIISDRWLLVAAIVVVGLAAITCGVLVGEHGASPRHVVPAQAVPMAPDGSLTGGRW